MASYWLRPATDRDLSAVRSLARRVSRRGRTRRQGADSLAVAAGDGVWVVEAGRGEIVGCCGVKEESEGNWRLAVLYLAPEWRGFGLGRSLLNTAIRFVRYRGGLALFVDVPAGPVHEGAELFRRLGFSPAPDGGDHGLKLVLGQSN